MVDIVVPIDDYSPVFQGDTGNPLVIQVLHQNGFLSIIGATITMKMQNVDNPATIQTCSGAWTIDPLDNGRASYAYQSADVATVGNWYLWIKVVIGGKTIHVDDGNGKPKILVIEALPVGV